MAVTRIKNNQITDASGANTQLGVNAAVKLQNYTVTATKIANNLVYGSDLTVTGNLTVQGNTTTIDTTITTIEDPVIVLASTQTTGAPAVDIGYLGYRGNQSNIAFVWDESADEFVTAFTDTGETSTTINITSYANFHTNDANIGGNIVINGTTSLVGNITGAVSFTGNITAGNLLTPGQVSATGNVTGGNVNTAGAVSATGNVTGGNVNTAGAVSATGTITGANITGSNFLTSGIVSAGGDVTGANINTAGAVSATGNIVAGNVTTVGVVSATGNVTGNYILGNGYFLTGVANSETANRLVNGTSNVDIPSANGNVTFGIGGTDNVVVVASTGIFTTGVASATGNVIGGNILTGGIISATGTITSATTITGGNLATGGTVSATGDITGGNVNTAGAVSATGNVTGGNVNTAGAVSATGNVTGGNILFGSGIVTGTGNIYGGNIIANDGFFGNIDLTGDITVNSLSANTFVSAGGNITGANLFTGGSVSATGNLIGNNVNTDNVYSSGALTLTAASGDITLNPSGNIVMDGGKYINNVNDPVQAQDAATKQYVDDAVSSGIHIHTPVYLEANSSINGTYAQGGNTFTVNQTIAGNTVVFTTAANLQVNDQLWFSNSFEGIVANTAYFVVSAPNTSAAVLSTSYNGAPVTNITSNTGLTQSVRVNAGVGATLTNAGANATLTIDGVTTTNGMRVLIYSQANAVHNGVYDVTEAGNATTAWQLTRSSDADLYIPDSSIGLDEGSYFYVQAGDTGAGESYVQTAPTGVFIIGYDPLTFTQFSASQVYTANTNAGLSLTGTVFSAKVDNNTTAFDGGGNIIVKAGANLTTPNIGAATGTSLSLTGNVTGGNVLSQGAVSAVGTVTGGNVATAGTVSATGNVTGGNLLTGGLVSATSTITSAANITGANLVTAGLVTATGDVIGGNISTAGQVTATGNVTGGNVNTAGQVSATGNITGGNLLTGGLISSTGAVTSGGFTTTGNVTGGNLLFGSGIVSGTGNIYANNIFANISGNIDAGGANTQIQFNDDDLLAGSPGFTFDKVGNVVTANGNITGANLFTGGSVSATANVTGGNILTGGLISATGTITSAANVTGANITTAGLVTATGDVIGGNISTAGQVTATGNVTGGNVNTAGLITATGNIYGGNLILAGAALDTSAGRLTVNSTLADADFAVNGGSANVFYIDAGSNTASFGSSAQTVNAIVAFNASSSVLMPVGNTGQRPGTGVTGMLRFNTTDNNLEIYNNTGWEAVGVPAFTVIADEQFNGDGSTVAFTLATSQTTNSCIVSINGVIQIPTLAYSVSTTTLTFTEAPAPGDVIDVRQITTTTTVTSISNSSGNAEIAVADTSATVRVTGNLIPTGNLTQTLGNATNRWSNLYVGGNTIFLGNLQLKEQSATTFAVFQADGVTQANIDAGAIDVSAITSGTSTVGIYGTGQTYMTVNGNANVLLASNTSVTVNGALTATGNVVGGNVTTAGLVTATGNVTGGNVNTAGQVTATGNVTGGNILTAGIISATGNVFGGNALFSGNLTVNGNVTYINSNVVTINDLAINLGNNAGNVSQVNNGGIELGPQGSPYVTFLYNSSANSMVSSVGLSAVGNVVGANFTTAGLVSATGNVNGGNLNVTGNIVDTAALEIITGSNGNITLSPNGTGVIVANKDIRNGQANGVGNIGASGASFNTIFAKATSAQYADLAEKYTADADYAPGTVVMFGGRAEITLCVNDGCSRVAGVISTNPSYRMNDGLVSEHTAMVALTGRVPTKVTGKIRKGDLMVSAGNGLARAAADAKIGTVIGKALEDFDGAEGVIEVVVGRL